MGLTGLSVAWKQAHKVFDMPLWISDTIAVLAVAVFLALLGAYSVKVICAPDKVLSEFRHPIAGNLFGTFLISVLLLPIVIAPVNLRIAQIMWSAGAVGMVVFAWTIVSLLALATIAIAGLLMRTLVGVVRGELRTLST